MVGAVSANVLNIYSGAMSFLALGIKFGSAHFRRASVAILFGVIGFIAAELLYGSRGPDSGATQFVLYGLVGFVPGVISSWLSHEAIDAPATA